MIARLVPLLLLATLATACTKPAAPRVATPAAPPVLLIQQAPAKTVPPPPDAIVNETISHCPTPAEIRKLRAARPKPLRSQAMPTSPAERVARTSAQLGLYEATGAWADQVEEAFARCDPS